MPAHPTSKYYRTPRGAVIHVTGFEVPNSPEPKALCVLIPGYNSYSGQHHALLASHLQPHGVKCFGIDNHSFGRSTSAEEHHIPPTSFSDSLLRFLRTTLFFFGRRAYMPNFNGLIEDLCFISNTLVEAHPGLPLYLLGESMGGALAMEASMVLKGRVKGLVLFAPMCSVGKAIQPPLWLQLIGRVMALLLPLLPAFVMMDFTDQTFKDPEAILRVKSDPLRFQQRVRLATAFELKRASKHLESRLGSVDPPSMLIVHGTADVVCPIDASLTLLHKSPCGDKALLEYQNAFHAVFAEPVVTRRRLIHDLLSWMALRVEGMTPPKGIDPSEMIGGGGGGGAGEQPSPPPPLLSPAAVRKALAQGTPFIATRPEGFGPFRDDTCTV